MLKKHIVLKRLKWRMIVKQNLSQGNRANKGEVKWTKKLCTGVTFVCLKLVSTN